MMKDKALRISMATAGLAAMATNAFAAEGTLSTVGTQITGAGTELLTAATPVITGAIGVGVVFWGAKLLWRKFKSMAS